MPSPRSRPRPRAGGAAHAGPQSRTHARVIQSTAVDPKLNFLFAILGGIVIISLAMALRSCRAPEIPPYFDRSLTLAAAIEQADREDRHVLALFTADWCPPCHDLKKGALASDAVTGWIAEHAVPAYVDVSKARSGDLDQQVLSTRYRVEALPTLLLLKDGRELGRITGNIPRRELLKWLRTFSDDPAH